MRTSSEDDEALTADALFRVAMDLEELRTGNACSGQLASRFTETPSVTWTRVWLKKKKKKRGIALGE